ncbi:epimerase [Chitinophaga caeni]|uniref:Epimerase n=1 Tax=Chitinophaga caeni TaxID=2029983 RepID=A0A291QQD3_9BACT|nr:SDR family oxidoreductase [Chitinophaga caeni]ATL46044.1 epimerase [Chitinophaga caeni]
MKRIIIFGASGATGQQVLKQALEPGYEVTAFVRDPAKILLKAPNLTVVQGDVLNAIAVHAALKNQDAVMCTLGAPANKTGVVRSQGSLNIIQGMQALGIKRLICQTSLGFGDGKEVLNQTSFIFKHIIVPFFLQNAFDDHAVQEDYIKKSGLDWTIIRPGNLTDGPLTGIYQHGEQLHLKKIKVKVSRADVAHLMLKELTQTQYLHKTPGISY